MDLHAIPMTAGMARNLAQRPASHWGKGRSGVLGGSKTARYGSVRLVVAKKVVVFQFMYCASL